MININGIDDYKVVVPHMEKPWCIHDDGFVNLKDYDAEREKLFKEYFSDEPFAL